MQDIRGLLNEKNMVLLVNGLGGIGKTEVCKAFLRDNMGSFKHVGWIDYISSIKESFVNQFMIEDITFGADETTGERYEKIKRYLTNLDPDSLLVIDNIEDSADENLQDIAQFPFKVIASSRMSMGFFLEYSLEFLSLEACKALFYEHYKGAKDDACLTQYCRIGRISYPDHRASGKNSKECRAATGRTIRKAYSTGLQPGRNQRRGWDYLA